MQWIVYGHMQGGHRALCGDSIVGEGPYNSPCPSCVGVARALRQSGIQSSMTPTWDLPAQRFLDALVWFASSDLEVA